jgi:hypothetical protein
MNGKSGPVIASAAVALLLAGSGKGSTTDAIDNSVETRPVEGVNNGVWPPYATVPPPAMRPRRPSVRFNVTAFSRPGWCLEIGDVFSTELFAGPNADRSLYEAHVLRERSLGDSADYACQFLQSAPS